MSSQGDYLHRKLLATSSLTHHSGTMRRRGIKCECSTVERKPTSIHGWQSMAMSRLCWVFTCEPPHVLTVNSSLFKDPPTTWRLAVTMVFFREILKMAIVTVVWFAMILTQYFLKHYYHFANLRTQYLFFFECPKLSGD